MRIGLASVVLVSLVPPASLRAQAAASDPDTREVAAYRLTDAALQKVAAAHRQLAVAMKADPRVARLAGLRAEKKALEAREEPSEAEAARLDEIAGEIDSAEQSLRSPLEGAKTLGDLEARIRNQPLLAGALKSAGLAPREYGTFMLALVQASLVHGLQKAGAAKGIPAELEGRLDPENVKFVAAHETEITRLMAEVRSAAGDE
jgi:hypothetical protein